MSKKVVVIGSGIVGASCAYYLHKAGHEVVLLEKVQQGSGASYVNAGYITPSHIIPLAAPGMVQMGMKYLFDSSGPFYMKPRFDLDFIKWAWVSSFYSNILRLYFMFLICFRLNKLGFRFPQIDVEQLVWLIFLQ